MLSVKFFAGLAAAALLPLVTGGATAPSQTYKTCQRKTNDPLEGCPSGTIYVSQDDEKAHFTSIQSAIESVPNNTKAYVILIAPGTYSEQLNVTRRGPLTLLGMSDRPWTNERYADINENTTHSNDVQVWFNAANTNSKYSDNAYTSVLTIAPNLNASLTGSGPTGYAVPAATPFGCTDFRAYNIDFHNEAYDYSNGPALALSASRANTGFYSCGFYSWQDTIYVGKLGNAYFYDTIVAGQTDFLYGFGTLYIEESTLSLRSCGGGITAWKGTNTTFVNKYGVYISDSQVIPSNSSIATKIYHKCSLGRPWNAEHRSVYMDTYLPDSILPAGYTAWSGAVNGNIGVNTTMAVWDVYGPGYNVTAEEAASNITQIFDNKKVAHYRKPINVFMTPDGKQPDVAWIDTAALV